MIHILNKLYKLQTCVIPVTAILFIYSNWNLSRDRHLTSEIKNRIIKEYSSEIRLKSPRNVSGTNARENDATHFFPVLINLSLPLPLVCFQSFSSVYPVRFIVCFFIFKIVSISLSFYPANEIVTQHFKAVLKINIKTDWIWALLLIPRSKHIGKKKIDQSHCSNKEGPNLLPTS